VRRAGRADPAAKGGSLIDMFATMSGDASNVLQELMSKAIGRVP
jgi:hypothetical protein